VTYCCAKTKSAFMQLKCCCQ